MGDRDAEVPAAAVDAAIKATEDAQVGAMATVIAIVAATESVRLRRRPKTASGLRRLRRRIMITHRAAAKATAEHATANAIAAAATAIATAAEIRRRAGLRRWRIRPADTSR